MSYKFEKDTLNRALNPNPNLSIMIKEALTKFYFCNGHFTCWIASTANRCR